MMVLILLVLLCAAICFGVFFLIFKLIWVIAKKKGNKWPLILSGSVTALVALVAAIGIMVMVNKFVRPFDPIIQAAQNKTTLTQGARTYTDPVYPFTISALGGTEFSRWINLEDINVKIGFDTNAFVLAKQNETNPDAQTPISGLAIIRYADDEPLNAQLIYAQTLSTLNQFVEKGNIVLTQPSYNIPAGTNNAMYLQGVAKNEQGMSFNFYLLTTVQGHEAFYVVGIAAGDSAAFSQAAQEVRSFRFASQPPALQVTASQPADVM